MVLVIDHSEDAFADRSENFGWTKAIRSVNIATVVYELLEGRDAYFEELVEVRTDNGEEFKPFKQRLGRVLSLFENALIKLQPTKLTI